jgi:4-hydroxy-tetrahydrodipicolinate synthase
MSGAFLIEEMRRGSVGTMPHCHIPDMFRRVIDLFLAGRVHEAEREFNRYTPLFRLHGPHVNKEVLRLRGVFKSSRLRHPVPLTDEMTLRELHRLVEELGLTG